MPSLGGSLIQGTGGGRSTGCPGNKKTRVPSLPIETGRKKSIAITRSKPGRAGGGGNVSGKKKGRKKKVAVQGPGECERGNTGRGLQLSLANGMKLGGWFR